MRSLDSVYSPGFPSCLFISTLFWFLTTLAGPVTSQAQDECACTGAISVFPDTSSFESEDLCPVDGSACAQPCSLSGESSWTNENEDTLDWMVGSGTTPSSNTGPNKDSSLGTGSGRYLYLESSCAGIGYSQKEARLQSRCLNMEPLKQNGGAAELHFSYHMFGEDVNELRVEYSLNNCLSWEGLHTIIGEQQSSSGDGWKKEIVSLVPLFNLEGSLSNLRLRIVGVTGGGWLSDIAIDDIEIHPAKEHDLAVTSIVTPTNNCALSNAETVTVLIENFGSNGEFNFDVQYRVIESGTPGPWVTETFSGTGNVIERGSSWPFTFETKADLSTVGTYEIEARTILFSDERPENNSHTGTVVNIPVVTSFPYQENFDPENPNDDPRGGWLSSGLNNTWDLGTPDKEFIQGAASEPNAWVTGGPAGRYKDSEHSQVVGPCFDFRTLIYPTIDMNVWWNSEGTYDGAVLQSSIDGGFTWNNVGEVNDQVNWYNDDAVQGMPGGQLSGWSGSEKDDVPQSSGGWLLARHPLSELAGNDNVMLRVAFGSDPEFRDDGFAFDDVVIGEGFEVTKVASVMGATSVGSTIRYTVEVKNTSARTITGTFFEDTPDPDTSLVVGSVVPSSAAIFGNSIGDTKVLVLLGTVPPEGTATIEFEVQINQPTAGSDLEVCNQGFVTTNSFTGFPSDDPSISGEKDPTCTIAYSDTDNDGVPDEIDLCDGPDDQDSDGDGTPDGCDSCSTDPDKTEPGLCGCGISDVDSDNDGTPNCLDLCEFDPDKTEAGQCGCGVPDTDDDMDGVAECVDLCPTDPNKAAPGICGCENSDEDSDGDGVADCIDVCPNDSNKTDDAGSCGCGEIDYICGCGIPDTDSDGDGVLDCFDQCDNDPNKTTPGLCGCGVSDTDDFDNDLTVNCLDGCPVDAEKVVPGQCGCGNADTDSDGDGTADCIDLCVNDPGKTVPGVCGCGEADIDSDGDTVLDCQDPCAADINKTSPLQCGCGVPDIDSDLDGVANCDDGCPNDRSKVSAGICGCGVPDLDTDLDGVRDCNDGCVFDSGKSAAGVCGCGVADVDTDGDGSLDCVDSCPFDGAKILAGACGCGAVDADLNANGITDCLIAQDFGAQVLVLQSLVKKLRPDRKLKRKQKQAQKERKAQIRATVNGLTEVSNVSATEIVIVNSSKSLSKLLNAASKKTKKALKTRGKVRAASKRKKRAVSKIRKLRKALGL